MMDEKHDDGLGGRSRNRREFSAANRWARPLCKLIAKEFDAAPLPDDVREAAAIARSINDHKALARQYQRIDKLVRLQDDDVIAAIDAFLADPHVPKTKKDAAAAELEHWCDRLIADGDEALEAWLELNPGADRQRLRTLARNARDKSAAKRRALRDALAP